MSHSFENSYGIINIDKEIIARIAGLATMECYGIVGMAARNMKDEVSHLLKIENLTKGLSIIVDEEGLATIDLHIIVEYGTNIMAITDSVKSTVTYKIKEYVNLSVKEINIFVEGIRV